MSKFEFVSTGKKTTIDGVAFLNDENNYIEEKFDGSRFGVHRKADSSFEVLSRGGIDRADNVPYIIEQLQDLGLPNGTVLDCEIIVLDPDRKLRWELTRSVMGTKGYNPALKAHLLIFDVQWWNGEYVGELPYLARRRLILEFVNALDKFDTYATNNLIAHTRAWPLKRYEWLWNLVVNEGNGEGIMIKNGAIGKYGKTWTKVKKEATCDCFILGATSGKGKYEGQIGTLELAVYNHGAIYPIGKISNVGTDDDRRDMTNMALRSELKDKVIEVKYNEVTKNFKLRHGRFTRWREDKAKEDCILEQLKEV